MHGCIVDNHIPVVPSQRVEVVYEWYDAHAFRLGPIRVDHRWWLLGQVKSINGSKYIDNECVRTQIEGEREVLWLPQWYRVAAVR